MTYETMETMQVGAHDLYYCDFYKQIITVIHKTEQQWLFYTIEGKCVDVATKNDLGEWTFPGC